jgi:hypothetical protein
MRLEAEAGLERVAQAPREEQCSPERMHGHNAIESKQASVTLPKSSPSNMFTCEHDRPSPSLATTNSPLPPSGQGITSRQGGAAPDMNIPQGQPIRKKMPKRRRIKGNTGHVQVGSGVGVAADEQAPAAEAGEVVQGATKRARRA